MSSTGTRAMKSGLALQDHMTLGCRLRSLKAELVDVRQTVKTALGSATLAYQSATRTLAAVQALQNALAHEAAGEYADQVPMGELQRLYGDGKDQ